MDEPRLIDLLENAPSGPYTGRVWRVTVVGQDPERPNTRGARWNPPQVSALYTSLSPECVRAEFRHVVDVQGGHPTKPAAEHTLEVRLTRVLDLTIGERLRQLGLDPDRFADSLESMNRYQQIGGAVAFLEFEGLLVPSVRLAGGVNLVIYTANVRADRGSYYRVVASQPVRTEDHQAE